MVTNIMRYGLNYKKLAFFTRGGRDGRGLREVADEISREVGEISASTLSRIEGERVEDISVSTLLIICSWLNIPPTEFIIDQDQNSLENEPDLNLADKISLLLAKELEPRVVRVLGAAVRAGIEATREEIGK